VTIVVDVRDLQVQFGGVRALDGVSVSVSSGEALAIVGPNGAGKSTLLNAINGVVRPSAGTIHLLGVRTDRWPAHKVARAGVRRSFQHPHVLDAETVLRNVMVGGHVNQSWLWMNQVLRPWRAARREAELRERCFALLATVGLEDVAVKRADELSYGLKKLVDIVRAVVGEPPVLLLDEPSSGMGEEDRRTLILLLHRIRNDFGTTLLLVEHHMDVVREVADRVLALAQGRAVVEALVSSVDDLESLGLSSAEADAVPTATPPDLKVGTA
jgi:ABC-type branched-subunit amino acid transport system ATPase component